MNNEDESDFAEDKEVALNEQTIPPSPKKPKKTRTKRIRLPERDVFCCVRWRPNASAKWETKGPACKSIAKGEQYLEHYRKQDSAKSYEYELVEKFKSEDDNTYIEQVRKVLIHVKGGLKPKPKRSKTNNLH